MIGGKNLFLLILSKCHFTFISMIANMGKKTKKTLEYCLDVNGEQKRSLLIRTIWKKNAYCYTVV